MKAKNSLFYLIKREVFSYLLNPVTYFAAIFYLLVSSFTFFYINDFFSLTNGSTDLRFFFYIIPYVLILVIPSLTMSLWEKEEYVSLHLPISTMQLVLSKWISGLLIFLCIFLVSLSVPFIVSFFGSIDYPILFSSSIGIILFASTLLSLGQLFTILFKNQASAFFSTSVFLSLFAFGSILLQNISVIPQALKAFFNFFSFTWHFDSFSKGIFDTRDIFFYIITNLIFLSLSVFVIEKMKYSEFCISDQKSLLKISQRGFIFLLTMILWNTQLYYTRIDITENQRFSLSDYSKNLLEVVDSNVTISYYISQELENSYPHISDIKDFLYAYSSEKKNVQVLIHNTINDSQKTSLNALGVSAQNIPSLQTNQSSIISAYSAIVFEYKGFTEVIPFVFDTSTLEFDIAGRLQSLLGSLQRSAFIIVANGLSLDTDYPMIVPILQSSGFSVRALQADDLLNTSLLDLNTPLILIGSSQLHTEHVQAIESFITSGGSVFFSVSPVDIDLDTWTATVDENYFLDGEIHGGIFTLLDGFNIHIDTSLIHDSANESVSLLSQTGETTSVEYPFFINIPPSNTNVNVLTSAFKGVTLLWPSPIITEFSTENTKDILFTSAQSWTQKTNSILYEQTQTPFITNPFFEHSLELVEGEITSYPVSSIHKKNVILVSDQYFLSRALSYVESNTTIRNFDYVINSLLYLQGHDELIRLKSKQFFDYSLHKTTEDSLANQKKHSIVSLIFIYSIAIIIAPLIIIYSRKKIQKRGYK